jgi:hypothetical protein
MNYQNFKKIINIIKKLIKKTLSPLFYSYPGYLLYNFIGKLIGYRKERQIISKIIGYYPDFKNPRSYNEKVLWKIIHDRNPLLTVISDKYRVREYLKDLLGKEASEKILIPLLYVTDKPETIPFDNLSEEYIIKANNACKKYIMAENKDNGKIYTLVDGRNKLRLSDCSKVRQKIINNCKGWISKPYGFYHYEWAYQKIKRKIIIEKLLRDEEGKIPADYKFNIFHGKCRFIQVYYNRFTGINRAWYTPEWEYINIGGPARQAPYRDKPKNLKAMIDLAELLGKPFDFIRVDLYSVNNRIYFGEFTNYPMGARTPFNPVSLDYEYGKKWKIIPGYWKK